MTETEKKALALVNEVAFVKKDDLRHCSRDQFREALCRAIEEHEAFRQEVSDALLEFYGGYHNASGEDLARFIIAKPDPLVDLCYSMGLKVTGHELRAAIKKRGGKIVWGEG